MNLQEACDHFGVREWGRNAPLAVLILRTCTESEQGCWLRSPTDKVGYTKVTIRSRRTMALAHRALYELMVGQIPTGLQLDHLCHTNDLSCDARNACLHRSCVNPAHLEPVTPQENNRRSRSTAALNAVKTHCKRGHEFTPENTYSFQRGGRAMRHCLTCRREAMRAFREARPDYFREYRARKKNAA